MTGELDSHKSADVHYEKGSLQPIQYMQEQMNFEKFEGFCLGNIMKYSSRFGYKDGNSKVNEARKILNYAKALYVHEQDKKINPNEDFE